MNRRDAFSDCHPAVNFLYYALVLVLSMSLMQPVCLAISLLCASWYLLRLQGWDALWQKLRWLLPVMALAAVMNPAFTHQGMTILTYLPSGNPLTLESILYGLAAAGLLERRPVPGDRRKTQLVCTEAASDTIRRGRELQKRFAEALLTGLDRESLETFHRCLAAIDVNIDNIRRNGV